MAVFSWDWKESTGEGWYSLAPFSGDRVATSIYRFGDFELDLSAFELRQNSRSVKLQRIPMELLIFLVEKEGQVASRQEIVDRLWGKDVFVDTEAGINTAIRKVRQALGDDPENPRFLQTVTGKGYRFVGAVRETAEETPQPVQNDAGAGAAPTRASEVREASSAMAAGPSVARRVVPWVVIGIVAAVAFFLFGPLRQLWRLHELQNLHTVRLTSLPGSVASPSFSPDGSEVAFAWDGESNGAGFDVYAMVIGSSDPPLRLTSHPAPRLSVAWSPDGKSIAFARVGDAQGSGLFLVSATGGPERKIADRSDRTWYGSELSWSPDGKLLAFIDRPEAASSYAGLQLYLLSLESQAKTAVASECLSAATPAFSHDGRWLAFVCNRANFDAEIETLRLSDRSVRSLLLEPETSIEGIAWSRDDKRIAFSTDVDSGALREVEVADPRHQEKLALGEDASDVASSATRDGIAYVKASYNVNIWRVDLSAVPAQAKQLLASSQVDKAPSISPDGKKIAFQSTRSGASEVWIADADGSNPQQISFLGSVSTGTPRWSPDGNQIAFDSRSHGEASIFIYDRSSGKTHKLDTDARDIAQASYSSDGRWIYFCNGADGPAPSIWKVPAEGGHAVRVSGTASIYALEGRDGKWAYFAHEGRLWRVRPDGGDPHLVDGMPAMSFLGDEWYPAQDGIYFMEHPQHGSEIDFFDSKTQHVRMVFRTERATPPWIGGMPVSNDGRWLLYPQVDHSSSDLMMMENWN